MPDQLPTWNYVAVHLRGTLTCLPDTAMRDMLDRQSADMEKRLCPKTPWTPAKTTPEVRDRMMRRILPFRLRGFGFRIDLQAGPEHAGRRSGTRRRCAGRSRVAPRCGAVGRADAGDGRRLRAGPRTCVAGRPAASDGVS
nr:FMN-binding negative transcriptional regulator [Jannaschia rubra]